MKELTIVTFISIITKTRKSICCACLMLIPVITFGQLGDYPTIRDKHARDIIVLNGHQSSTYTTSSVSQLDVDSVALIGNNPILNNTLKLTGMLPGLTIFQSNGEPGEESARYWIRGKRTLRSNTPIILVDGYERDFSFLDPSEIASVTVLKDAAATAQYGLRGGNGIISITTKRGKVGKVKIGFNASAGLKHATTRPSFLNSYDYACLYNEAYYNDQNDGSLSPSSFTYPYSQALLNKYQQAAKGELSGIDSYLYPDVHWYNDYIRKSTWQQHYNVYASGGSQTATFFVSLGYTDNSGLFNVDKDRNTYNTNTDMKMITLRSNVDVRATKRMLVSMNFWARQIEGNNPGSNSSYSSRIMSAIYQTPPNAFPVIQPNGLPGGTKDYTDNVYGLLNLQGYSLVYQRNLTSDVNVVHDLDFITRGLKVHGSFSFDGWFNQITNRSKTFKVYDINTTVDPVTGLLSPVYGEGNELTYIETGTNSEMGTSGSYPSTYRTFSWKFKLDYERRFLSDYLYAMIGYTQRSIQQENNTELPRQYRGLISRISFAHKDRYLAEFNVGYEGSEQMANHNKFGFFPAVSIGWVVSEEPFMKKQKVVDYLKLRASDGITGNDDIGGYFSYLQHFNKGNGTEFGTSSTSFDGWEESAMAGDATWERVHKTNFGMDVSLFKRRLNFSADIFHEEADHIMVESPLPLTIGTKLSLIPIGKVRNQGYEMSISWRDRIGKLAYELVGIYSTNNNKVLEKGELDPLYDYQRETGHHLGSAWGYEAIGYFTQTDINNPSTPSQAEFGSIRPGDIMYKDQNNDGVINSYDKVYLGQTDIPNQASLSLLFSYGKIDIGIQFVGQWGGSMSLNNQTAYEFYKNGGVMEHHLNRYNPQRPDEYQYHGMKFYKGDYPRLSLSGTNNRQGSSFWRVPTDLLRLKNIELGYNFTGGLLQQIKASKLRLYVNAYNLHTWSHSKLIDIESNSGSGMIYPIQRIFNFGVKMDF